MSGRYFSAIFAVLIGILPALALGEDAPDPSSQAPQIDSKADAVLRTISDFYHKSHTFQTKMDTHFSVRFSDLNIDLSRDQTFSLELPNRFALRTKGTNAQGSVVISDGKKLTAYTAPTKSLREGDAPESLAAALSDPLAALDGLLPLGILASFVEADAYASTMEGVTSAKYVGLEKIGEVECDHVACSQADFDWDIWVQRGDTPLLLREKILIDKYLDSQLSLQQLPEEIATQIKGLQATISVDFRDWQFDQQLPESLFQFVAPPEAKGEPSRAASADPASSGTPRAAEAARAGASEDQDDDEPVNELVGKPVLM